MKTFIIPVVLYVYGDDEKHAIANMGHDLQGMLNDADNSLTGFELLVPKETVS